jgi:uncharacterized protein YndB with AHSA1/START domain
MSATDIDARDILSTRVIDAPAEKIFRAMSQPAALCSGTCRRTSP